MPKTDASLGPLTCRRRRDQARKAKAEAARQQKELQSARGTKEARSKPAKPRTRSGSNCACMDFVSEDGARWYIIHHVQQQGFTMATAGKDGEWAEYFKTPKIDVKYAQRTSNELFGSASVSVWKNGSKTKKSITCLRFYARRVLSFLIDCKCA